MNSHNQKKKVAIITEADLQYEIRRFDSMLDAIQRYYPENEQTWDIISNIRDGVFRLQQTLRKCNTIDFSSMSEDAWVNLKDREQET